MNKPSEVRLFPLPLRDRTLLRCPGGKARAIRVKVSASVGSDSWADRPEPRFFPFCGPPPTDRIPTGGIKSLIQQLATRTNFGLDPSDLPPVAAPTGSSATSSSSTSKAIVVPAGLQLWVWEVDDDKLWVTEFAARLGKRRNERREVSLPEPGALCSILRLYYSCGNPRYLIGKNQALIFSTCFASLRTD